MKKLMEMIISDPPDVLVNLGDFTEPMYETPDLPNLLPEWSEVQTKVKTIARLMGNHEAGFKHTGYKTHWSFDGIRYEHGHYQVGMATHWRQFETGERYNQTLREVHRKQLLVHGHTHIPYVGEQGWPVDVGTVTHRQTYGEIIDGTPYIREIH